ncbi:hypothetical protein N7470_007117 [Penicillium chermesinum]|nr:hypothetical protein N7470_007117 [Penicillium chermesinum]
MSKAGHNGRNKTATTAHQFSGRHSVLDGAVKKASAHEARVAKTTYPPNDIESFEREYNIMSTVSKIPALASYVPRLIGANRNSGTIVLSTPKLRWFRLLNYMEASKIDLDQMLELKKELRSYVDLLYSHGVAYRVKHDFIYPAQKVTGRWVLHLAGWMDADFCGNPSQLESAEWKQRETEQLNEIERIFELLMRRYEDLQDARIRGQRGHRIERWNLTDQLRGQN